MNIQDLIEEARGKFEDAKKKYHMPLYIDDPQEMLNAASYLEGVTAIANLIKEKVEGLKVYDGTENYDKWVRHEDLINLFKESKA